MNSLLRNHNMYFRFIGFTMMILISWIFVNPGHAAWQVDFQVSLPDQAADNGHASNRLILGTDNTATDNFDNLLDTVAYNGGGINAYFVHPEYATAKSRLWQDMRENQLPKTWEVEVSSSLKGQANISWDTNNVPSNVSLKLTDGQTGTTIDMKTMSEYTFQNSPTVARKITLLASQDAGAGETPQTSSQGGGCGYIKDIGNNKSNPMNPGTAAINVLILFIPLVGLRFLRLTMRG